MNHIIRTFGDWGNTRPTQHITQTGLPLVEHASHTTHRCYPACHVHGQRHKRITICYTIAMHVFARAVGLQRPPSNGIEVDKQVAVIIPIRALPIEAQGCVIPGCKKLLGTVVGTGTRIQGTASRT